MDEEAKQKLMAKGREDLIKAFEILESGNGAILPNGNIVDKREHPEAMVIPPNNPFLKIHPLEAIEAGKKLKKKRL